MVDVNLRDRATGPSIGKRLAEKHGVIRLFLTANPAQRGTGVDGTIGVLSKPVGEDLVESVLDFLLKHQLGPRASPPPEMRLFDNDECSKRAYR